MKCKLYITPRGKTPDCILQQDSHHQPTTLTEELKLEEEEEDMIQIVVEEEEDDSEARPSVAGAAVFVSCLADPVYAGQNPPSLDESPHKVYVVNSKTSSSAGEAVVDKEEEDDKVAVWQCEICDRQFASPSQLTGQLNENWLLK